MNMNASKRYLLGIESWSSSWLRCACLLGRIAPTIQAAPTIVPDIEVVQVQQQDVAIIHEWIGRFDG
jgi:hypothetical protein